MSTARNKEEQIIVKEATGLAASRYVSQAILAVRGFIIAKFLGPSLYGVWNLIMTTTTISENVDAGTGYALIREIPQNSGKRNETQNEKIISSGYWWQLAITAVISVLLLIGSVLPIGKTYSTELQLLSIILLLQNSFVFLKIIYLGRRDIKNLATVEFLYAIINTVAGLSLLFAYSIKGLLLGMIITYGLLLVFGQRKLREEISRHYNSKRIKNLIAIGFPILIIGFSIKLMENIDKIIIFIFLGSQNTGYYGLAAFITLIIMYIPQVISNVLYPRMNHKYARTKNKKSIEEYYTRPMNILTYAMPVFLGLIIINTKWILTTFLPEYLPATTTIQILTASLFFVSTIKSPTDVLLVFNKQKMVMKTNLLLLACGIIIDLVLVHLGIEAVAIGTGITFMALSLIINQKTLKEFRTKHKLKVHVGHHTSFMYCTIILFFSIFATRRLETDFISGLVTSLIFFIMSLPMLYIINKKEGLVLILKKLLARKST